MWIYNPRPALPPQEIFSWIAQGRRAYKAIPHSYKPSQPGFSDSLPAFSFAPQALRYVGPPPSSAPKFLFLFDVFLLLVSGPNGALPLVRSFYQFFPGNFLTVGNLE